MKFFLALLLISAPLACDAASPEDDYVAARDRAVAAFTATDVPGTDVDARNKQHDLLMGDLEKQLRAILGPVSIKGFSASGKINLDTLYQGDEGFGMLDGLVYASPDERTHVVVTTEGLLRHWLRRHKTWWEKQPMPQDFAAALKWDSFYTQAISTDSAISKYSDVPIARRRGVKLAVALLAMRSQDIAPQVPNELIVSVVRGGKVYVANTKPEASVVVIPVCQAIWQEAERKAAAATSGHVDIRERAGADFLRCFTQRARRQAFFPALRRQAQELADLLAGR